MTELYLLVEWTNEAMQHISVLIFVERRSQTCVEWYAMIHVIIAYLDGILLSW